MPVIFNTGINSSADRNGSKGQTLWLMQTCRHGLGRPLRERPLVNVMGVWSKRVWIIPPCFTFPMLWILHAMTYIYKPLIWFIVDLLLCNIACCLLQQPSKCSVEHFLHMVLCSCIQLWGEHFAQFQIRASDLSSCCLLLCSVSNKERPSLHLFTLSKPYFHLQGGDYLCSW